jgi:hypothetical protein
MRLPVTIVPTMDGVLVLDDLNAGSSSEASASIEAFSKFFLTRVHFQNKNAF